MTDLHLTEAERVRLMSAAKILVCKWKFAEEEAHGTLYTEDAGWVRAIEVCGCDYPRYRVTDTGQRHQIQRTGVACN